MITVKRIAGIIGFILIFLLILREAGEVLMHKQIEGRWNMTAKVAGFYNEEPNSLDVIFFGSSHAYCSIDPKIFYRETGLNSYIFTTQQQPLWISYHYMIEALKTQKPKLMAVEIHMAIHDEDGYLDEATNHTAIDPIPFSKNKLEMIKASVPEGERRYYIFNIMKYHERWEELGEADYVRSYRRDKDPEKGHVRLSEISDSVVWEDVSEIKEIKIGIEKNIYYINRIIDLAEKEGIDLLLFKSPSNATVEEKMYYNGVYSVAEERGVDYIDFNSAAHYENMGLDIRVDFYDQRHLNENGVAKFVPYLANIINSIEESPNHYPNLI